MCTAISKWSIHWIIAGSMYCDNTTLLGVRYTLCFHRMPGKLSLLLSHLATGLMQFPWLLLFHKVNCRHVKQHAHETHQSITTTVAVAGRVAPRHALSPQGVSANLATAVGGLTLINTVGSRPLVYLSSLSCLHTGFKIELVNDVPAPQVTHLSLCPLVELFSSEEIALLKWKPFTLSSVDEQINQENVYAKMCCCVFFFFSAQIKFN